MKPYHVAYTTVEEKSLRKDGLVTTTIHEAIVEWYREDARSRTIMVHDVSGPDYSFHKIKTPALSMAVVKMKIDREGCTTEDYTPLGLYVYERLDNGKLVDWACAGPVCLGIDAAELIEAGELHAVDAFWNTVFDSTVLNKIEFFSSPVIVEARKVDGVGHTLDQETKHLCDHWYDWELSF